MPDQVELPPILVTPHPPPLLPPSPHLVPGHTARPLPWDQRLAESSSLDELSKKVNLYTEQATIALYVIVRTTTNAIDTQHLEYRQRHTEEINSEITAAMGEGVFSRTETLTRKQSAVQALIHLKREKLQSNSALSNSFFGNSPLNRNPVDFVNALQTRKYPGTANEVFRAWIASYTAATSIPVLAEAIQRLTDISASLDQEIATAYAEEHAQMAAEASQRAQEAAQAEAIRVAEALERDRVEAQAQAIRAAEMAEQTLLDAERTAQEQERTRQQAEKTPDLIQQAGQSVMAMTQPALVRASGNAAFIEMAATVLQAAIREAVAAIGRAVASLAPGLSVGISALVYSPKLGNGELPEGYTFSTSLSDLATGNNPEQNLGAIDARSGYVDLPYRLGWTTSQDGQREVILAKTDGVSVPSSVRVLAATYNPEKQTYTVTTDDIPPKTLIWTPIPAPETSSTTLPSESPSNPIYLGNILIPVIGQLETYPSASDIDFRDLIITFPADSGIAAVYTMFNHRPGDLIFDDKITDQLADRGWNEHAIRTLVINGATGRSVDKRRALKTPDGMPRDDTATVYGTLQEGYIVVNDRTGEIIQISEKNNTKWITDDRIIWNNK